MRLWPRRKVYVDNLPKTHDVRFGLFFGLGILVILGGLYFVGYLVAGNKLPVGTTIAQQDVGGMSPAEARTVLQDKLAKRLEKPIEVTAAGKTYTFDPQRSGLTFDLDTTLQEAAGGSPWDPRHMIHVLTGGDDVDPVVMVDDQEMSGRLKKVAEDVGQEPVDSKVTFSRGEVTIEYGHAGRQLDYQRSGARLVAALIAGKHEAALPLEDVQPQITAIEATRFVDDEATPALNGPIRIKVADGFMTLTPKEFGPALVATPVHQGLELGIDEDALATRTADKVRTLPHHPVNAGIRFKDDTPVVIPSSAGVTVTPADLSNAVLKAVRHQGDKRVARAVATPENPTTTSDDVRLMQINEQVSGATAPFIDDGSDGPAASLARLDAAMIRPGETFSFINRVPDAGSPGASLVASLTYDAAFHAGLGIPDHTDSRIYSPVFPPGQDAHVEPPSTDLVLENTTPYGIYVRAYVDKPGGTNSSRRVAHVEMWSTKYWTVRTHTSHRYNLIKPQLVTNARRSCVPRQGVAGFEVDVTRVLRRDGHLRTDHFHSSYASLDMVRCSALKTRPGRP